MLPRPAILADLTAVRNELQAYASARRELLRVHPLRPLADIAFDWVVVALTVAFVVAFGWWYALLAVVLIANRQRALGNILHDAGHRNLSREPIVNDWIAGLLVAPLLFASLSQYRATHFRHHQALGDATLDPDVLPAPSLDDWRRTYWRNLSSWHGWIGSVFGHLADTGVPLVSKVYIAGWWCVVGVAIGALAGEQVLGTAVALWLLSRATAFHAITMFREMCDHVGLTPGGIFSFTRDITCRGPWRWLIHPRNNGFHLTHHLCPAVPYYLLPQAQKLFVSTPSYRKRAVVCEAYFGGWRSVTPSWSGARA
jgi:fatty acid desaturase